LVEFSRESTGFLLLLLSDVLVVKSPLLLILFPSHINDFLIQICDFIEVFFPLLLHFFVDLVPLSSEMFGLFNNSVALGILLSQNVEFGIYAFLFFKQNVLSVRFRIQLGL
jgi:hypothetical protein